MTIKAILMIKKLYSQFKHSTGVCTDTRNLEKGNLFFALKGPTFNGNEFAEKALNDGAKYAVIDDERYKKDERYILVEDVLSTLQELAKYHRKQLKIPIICITGSNGKTTTKELLATVLKTTFKTFATQGNLNNHIGVPLSLLSIKKEHEIAIIEMGASHQGEIAAYCAWALPQIGLITNIGSAHLEGFGGIEGVIKGKTELYQSLANNKGLVFYHEDDDIIREKSKMIPKRISYGKNKNADYSFKVLKENPTVKISFQDVEITSNLTGAYNATNIMVAAAVGAHFGVSNENIKKGIESYFPDNNRSQIIEKNGVKYIMDAYNANPTSMQAALESFAKMNAPQKMVIMGDMFELGSSSSKEHLHILEVANTLGFDKIIAVGEHFSAHQENFDIQFFSNTESLKTWFQNQKLEDYNILIKGSRGMKLESLLESH
jgi:UDP-N-acetylmuramoyl-tripeptide--D-alanyl-D-alanine ligase